jgi:hypothetical protein
LTDFEGARLRGLAERAEKHVLRQLIGTRRLIFEKTANVAVGKAKAWWLSIWLLVVGLVSSVACIMQTG